MSLKIYVVDIVTPLMKYAFVQGETIQEFQKRLLGDTDLLMIWLDLNLCLTDQYESPVKLRQDIEFFVKGDIPELQLEPLAHGVQTGYIFVMVSSTLLMEEHGLVEPMRLAEVRKHLPADTDYTLIGLLIDGKPIDVEAEEDWHDLVIQPNQTVICILDPSAHNLQKGDK